MEFLLGLVIGLLIGAGLALLVGHLRSRQQDQLMRETFSALAADALDANAKRLSDQAATTLDGKKELIDQSIKAVNERLSDLGKFMQSTEAGRKEEFGKLTGSITRLTGTTDELHRMLASTQRRGAWGERMAEDILRLAGLQENVNYAKQSGDDAESGRPDFTFFLPNDYRVNMDVKFPLGTAKAYLDAEDEAQQAAALESLAKAVKKHIQDVAGRGYVDPGIPTVDYAIVFIPSEQIFSLALSAKADLIDEALGKKVVLAGPLTLYAMLAVIRQAAERAVLMKEAGEVLAVLTEFTKQWDKYNDEVDKLGQRIQQTADQFEAVSGTRSRQLQRQLDKISDLQLPSDN